jgi:hypothetical protein
LINGILESRGLGGQPFGTICVLTQALPSLSRRTLLTGAAAALATACGRKLGSRYQGWLFVASGRQPSIAVANLSQFRLIETIALPHVADQLYQSSVRVYALSRAGSELIELEPDHFRISGRIALPGKAVAMRLLADQATAVIAVDEPAQLLVVDLKGRKVVSRIGLPAAPADLDLSGAWAAITLPSRKSLVRVSIPGLKLSETALDAACETVRFRRDGKTVLTGASASREIITVNADSGAVWAHLPLPVVPSRFCFNGDGGQMFVTGAGEDAVSIVNPYQNEVDQTILAGRRPGAMTISSRQNLLFLANPESGDLTILDIDTRHLSASVHVGERPGEVLVTPDGEYALVIDSLSGNVSVVRVSTVLDHKNKTKPLFTVFPTTPYAHSALIVPFKNQTA